MKYANAALQNILAGGSPFFYADLWKFDLRCGITKLYTDWQFDVTIGSDTYLATESFLSASPYKLHRGLDVDECQLIVNQASTDTVSGLPFAEAVANGLFDRAIVTKYRQFLNMAEAMNPIVENPSANTLLLFLGELSDISIANTYTDDKVKSLTNLLNINMPRRQYQPTCGFVFGDANCTKSRASLAVSTSSTLATVTTTLTTGLTNAAGYFNNGTARATSGENLGVVRTIKNYQNGIITLVAPFPATISVGDTFTVTPGCNKSYSGTQVTINAAAMTGSTPTMVLSTLKYAAGYFTGGTLTFTSGDNAGQTKTISSWETGKAILSSGFTNTPAVGDSFYIIATTGSSTGSCSGYSNTTHFGGMPYIPVPETSF